jgi:hydroxymethylglutaryl-CoA reductase
MKKVEPRGSSRLPGFYRRSLDQRLETVRGLANLTADEVLALRNAAGFGCESADRMVENAIGVFPLPLGLAANFRLNGEDLLVPMAVEEPSVLAAASNAANLLRDGLGIITSSTEPIMIGQIQVLEFGDLAETRRRLEERADSLVAQANAINPRLLERGGGAQRLVVREFPETAVGPMIIVHLEVNVCEAMGANIINTMVESIAPEIEAITEGRVRLRILSNLADKRLVKATGRVSLERLARGDWTGEEVARGIVEASVMADVDPYRAATHNKGAMNGVDAFLVAAGQDWRAVEAGCHAYAARDGRYRSLSRWVIEGDALVGTIEIPMQVGVVGGITKTHPVVKVVHKILGFPSAARLGEIAAASGLAQNLAAIMALATDGIQKGHMSMHARNIAVDAGATGDELEAVVSEMRKTRDYSSPSAAAAIATLRGARA